MSNFGQANVLSTRRDTATSRLKVDVANTAFWEGKEFRVSYEYSISGTQVLKFTSTRDFILQRQVVSCDAVGVILRVYRDSQGTESGTFDETIPTYGVNIMSETPSFTSGVSIVAGGTFTPNVNEPSVETIRVKVSNSTAQRSTVTGAAGDERGLPAGTYYLVLENISGSGTATGVYDLKWEERA